MQGSYPHHNTILTVGSDQSVPHRAPHSYTLLFESNSQRKFISSMISLGNALWLKVTGSKLQRIFWIDFPSLRFPFFQKSFQHEISIVHG